MEKKVVLLFYCAESEDLARKVAAQSNSIKLQSINWRSFDDGSPNYFVNNAHDIRGQHVAFLASFSSPAVIFEQLSVIYALPQLFVASFTLVLPFFPTDSFERKEGEADEATVFTMAQILSNIPISKSGPTSLVTFDIHALQERSYFRDHVLPCFETGIPLLKQRLHQLPDADNIVIAFPDNGASKRFYKQLQHFPVIVCTTVREGDKRIVRLKEGNPAGRHVVIVDDLVQSGGTLIECQKVLAAHGAAKVSAYVTHGVFPKCSWERFTSTNEKGLEKAFTYFWITDSCPDTVKAIGDKAPFEILGLAGSIANALQIITKTAVLNQSELPKEPVGSDDAKIQTFVFPSPGDFGAWTSLITKTEKAPVVDVEKICLVYNSFLSLFPLCYGYWKKYANHMANLRTVDKVVEVYERAVQLATYSVHLWVDYCTFATLLFEDPMDVRRLFERGISFVGKDYMCHLLWDKYIEFEYTQKQWSSLAHIFIRSLKFPTKKLNSYYDSFKKLATIWEQEIKFEGAAVMEVQSEADFDITDKMAFDDVDIPGVIRDLLDPTAGLRRHNALEKYLSIGAQFYQKASQIDAEIHFFESRIRRPYFHVKPLDVSQLENWHHYLDFVEMQGDFDWTVKLYERCLIPCANYPEFWMRYVEHMESNGGREIANFALVRATEIFLKGVPQMHFFCANFKEKIGDALGAHASFHNCYSELDSDFIEKVKREANMEKRLGNSEAALSIYEKALEMAKEKQNSYILSILYVQFCRFKYMVTGCIDAARNVLIQGIQYLPNCKYLIEGLVNFEMMHRGPWKIDVVDSVVADVISPGPNASQELNTKDREDISSLYLEFVDQCGTIDDIRNGWQRHRKLFPHILMHTSCNYTTVSQDMLITQPSHAPEDKISNGSVNHLMLDQKVAPPERLDIESDHAVTFESQPEGIDNTKETLPPLSSSEVVAQSRQNATQQNSGANENGGANHREAQESPGQYKEGAIEVQKYPGYEPSNDMKPPSLENLSLNPQDDVVRDSTPTVSYESEAPRETPRSQGSEPQDGCYISSIHCSSSPSTQAGNSTQIYVEADSGPTRAAIDPSYQQAQLHLQPQVPRSNPSDPCAVRGGNWDPMNCTEQTPGAAGNGFQGYPQTQHPQQWQVSQQPQHPSPGKQGILTRQGYPCQPFGENTQMQPGHVLPAENMQQQRFTSAPQPPPQAGPQPVSFSQAQVYPYPVQSNEFYGQMQNNPAYINHLWHYYYMQQQHQQQQNPQLQEQQQLHQQQQQQPLVLQQQQQQQLQPQLQKQQNTVPQIQTWNNSYYQQDQGTTMPNTESAVPASPAIYQGPQQHPPTN